MDNAFWTHLSDQGFKTEGNDGAMTREFRQTCRYGVGAERTDRSYTVRFMPVTDGCNAELCSKADGAISARDEPTLVKAFKYDGVNSYTAKFEGSNVRVEGRQSMGAGMDEVTQRALSWVMPARNEL